MFLPNSLRWSPGFSRFFPPEGGTPTDSFVFVVVAVGLLCFLFPANAADQAPIPVVLENENLRIEVDPGNGVISRVSDKQGQIHVAPVAGLADNFRLVLRGADKKDRVILGRGQKLSEVSKTGDVLDLTWNQPLADTQGGKHDVRVRMKIRLVGELLEFRIYLQNESEYKVAAVWYPLIGGLTGFGRGQADGETFLMLPTASPSIKKVAMPFAATAFRYPGHMNMSYCSVFNTKSGRAMYFASHDNVARLKYYRFFEQSSPNGKDIFACIQHVPFTPAGESFEGSPVVLRFHDGTWPAAGPIYRDWFTKTFGLMDPSRNWIRRHSFVQDTMFILPEGTLNYTFQDIPRWAKDARDHGITAVLVSGWHRGGHDNGYPHYEPDPRLGTYEDLKMALDACHKMGVQVYFFVNYQPAMIESEWFKRELNRYVEMREDGNFARTGGWGMGTLWARMGHPKMMAWVDPSFPEYRDALLEQFRKLVEAGADGLHVDKMFPCSMNFNPRCELGPDTSTWEGAVRITRVILDQSRKINPDFAMSFECNWDRMLQFGNAMWWVGNMSIVRSVFPEMVETRAITSPYDYLGVNNAVRSSQVGLLGPLNYSRSVGCEPWNGLADYIREVKQIQDRLSETVFLGEVLGHEQIKLEHEPHYGVEYNVFRCPKTGKRSCILTNSDMEDHVQGIAGFEGTSRGSVRIHAPLVAPWDAALPAKVTVPAERIVFVEELPATASRNEPAAPPVEVDSTVEPASDGVPNGGFESGDFTGWTADQNWRVDRNTCGAYRGWEGNCFAWSGGQGEAATGRLRSKPFLLDKDAVRLLMAGWNTAPRSNRTWNYVVLKLADGTTEIDRRSAPNSLAFVPVVLDGSDHKGKLVYLEAVDDADQGGFSMFCVDDVRTVPLSSRQTQPLDPMPRFDDQKSIKLENDRYRVEVSRANGAITRILDTIANLDLIREPRLAGNFKFTLPLPGKEPWETIEANYILGKDQPPSSFDVHGRTLTLRWRKPLKSRTGEKYNVAVTMGIELEDEAVRFTLRIKNETPYQIGEVFFPILGGVTGPGKTHRELKTTQLVRPSDSGAATKSDIFSVFANRSGLGDQGPEQYYLYPKKLPEPWMEFHSPKHGRSIYLGAHGPDDRSKVLHLEMLPGNAVTPRWDGNWPRFEELKGLPAGVLVSFVDFANHPPGKTYEAPPVVLQAHDGDWRKGQRIYRTWKDVRQ